MDFANKVPFYGAVVVSHNTVFDVRMPRLAATTWIDERAPGREMLYTYMPLVERRDHPLGRAVLLDLVRWLATD